MKSIYLVLSLFFLTACGKNFTPGKAGRVMIDSQRAMISSIKISKDESFKMLRQKVKCNLNEMQATAQPFYGDATLVVDKKGTLEDGIVYLLIDKKDGQFKFHFHYPDGGISKTSSEYEIKNNILLLDFEMSVSPAPLKGEFILNMPEADRPILLKKAPGPLSSFPDYFNYAAFCLN